MQSVIGGGGATWDERKSERFQISQKDFGWRNSTASAFLGYLGSF